jgi:hypothetical protein
MLLQCADKVSAIAKPITPAPMIVISASIYQSYLIGHVSYEDLKISQKPVVILTDPYYIFFYARGFFTT